MSQLDQLNGWTLGFAVVGMLVLLALRGVAPQLPGPLLLVALGIVVMNVSNLAVRGVVTVGEVPRGLPGFEAPPVENVSGLVGPALGIALMAFVESIAAARAFGRPDEPRVGADLELIALRVASLSDGFFQAYPASGGLSQTADVLVVRPSGRLYFGDVEQVTDQMRALVDRSTEPVRTVVIDASAPPTSNLPDSGRLVTWWLSSGTGASWSASPVSRGNRAGCSSAAWPSDAMSRCRSTSSLTTRREEETTRMSRPNAEERSEAMDNAIYQRGKAATSAAAADLRSWKDGATKRAIVDFVSRVTTPGDPDYVAEDERVAVFDNDGTLWCERPAYIQLAFIVRRLATMATEDPSLRDRQPWRAAHEGDLAWFGQAVAEHYQGDDRAVHEMTAGLVAAHAGMSVEAFEQAADDFLRGERHPTLDRLYIDCGYAPMVELLRFLEARGFTCYIASGGGRDFMRPVTDEMYGIPRDRVIGSTIGLRYEADDQGGSVVRQAALEVFDDGPEKPVRIWSRIGRRPIMAAGNSNGDIPMLRYAKKAGRPSLSLLLLHDDADREFAYTAGAQQALAMAKQEGWTVVSMKDDWHQVFTVDP